MLGTTVLSTRPNPKNFLGEQVYCTVLLALVLLGLFLAPMSGLQLRKSVISLSDGLIFLSAGMALLLAVLQRRSLLISPLMMMSAVLMVTGFVVAVLLDNSAELRESRSIVLMVGWFLIPLLLLNLVSWDPAWLRPLLFAWMLGTVVNALIGICHYHGFVSVQWADLVGAGGVRERGLTNHPNIFGLNCAIALPLMFERFRRLQFKFADAVLSLLGALVLLYAINLSGSRGALGLAAAAILLTSALRDIIRGRIPVLALVLTGMAISAVLVGALADYLNSDNSHSALSRLLPGSNSASVADVVRSDWRQLLVEEFLENPIFGNGYRLRGVHDFVFGALATSGVVGVIAQLLREAFAMSDWKRLMNTLLNSPNFVFGSGVLVSYIVWLLSLTQGYWLIERCGVIVIGFLAACNFKYSNFSVDNDS